MYKRQGPQILHVVTTKGKGYVPAESHPDTYHGVAPFLVETGELRGEKRVSCGHVAAAELAALAENDIRICAVTAAMPTGTGMEAFGKAYPKRFYDVGIAEEHAVTMAAGMAASGMKPYVAVYSTSVSYTHLMDISLSLRMTIMRVSDCPASLSAS